MRKNYKQELYPTPMAKKRKEKTMAALRKKFGSNIPKATEDTV